MKSILAITETLQRNIENLQEQLEQSQQELVAYQALLFSELLQSASDYTLSIEILIEVKEDVFLDEYQSMTSISARVEIPSCFFKAENLENIVNFFNRTLPKSGVIQDASLTDILTSLPPSEHFVLTQNSDDEMMISCNTDLLAIQWVEGELCKNLRISPERWSQIKANRDRESLLESLPSTSTLRKSPFL